jgi:TonB-dependent receptor
MSGKVHASVLHGDTCSLPARARLAVAVAMGMALMYGPIVAQAQDTNAAPASTGTQAAPSGTAAPKKITGSDADKKKAKNLAQVNVTGIRASLESAQALKQNASQIVDSVTAVDINALPDRSVTETLQRISGVTIDRFISPADADHPAGEGSGVMIRGLTQVASLLNGRDTFSANSGRGLSFEDVPAELMSGVDVYKNPNAEIIEGGIGGTVDLRTRMPFDAPGQQIGFSTGINEGDISEKSKPSASFLYSNRWKSDSLGEFGALLDVSYSELASQTDGIQLEPFTLRTDSAALAGTNFSHVYVPGGADWRTLDFQRRRMGIAGAFQWRPTNDLEFYSQFMRSSYRMSWLEHGAIFDDSTFDISPATGTDFNYNSQGVFQSGWLNSDTWRGNYAGSPTGVAFNGDTRYQVQTTTTTDWSNGFKYNLNDHMILSGDVQLVKSTSNETDFTIFSETYLPGVFLNTTGSHGMPSITVSPSTYVNNPANYFWAAAMDHVEDERGMERAARLDLEYDFEDNKWLQYMKFGIRATDRDEDNVSSPYNWGAITQPWATIDTPSGLATLNTSLPSYSSLYSFANFFRGQVTVPSLYFPLGSLATNYSQAYSILKTIEASGGWKPVQITPADLNDQGEKTKAAYGILYFGNDDALGIPVDGNIGIRLVRTSETANGEGQYPTLAGNDLPPAVMAMYNGQYFPVDGHGSYQNALPSFNLRFKLTDDLQWRLAASKAMTRPDFTQLQPFLLLGATLNTDKTAVTQWTGTAGNPDLKPMIAKQYDTALEWYFAPTGLLYTTAFFKDIGNYIAEETETEVYNNQQWSVTRPYNIGTGMVRGAEFGYNQFFDFLPGWLKGLGVQANYTYVHSEGGVNTATNPYSGAVVTGFPLPMVGLSPHSYNFALMYQEGPWQARMAYSWRSQYLLSTSDANTHLPMWAGNYGQLDASVFYKVNANIQVGLTMNNLTNSTVRTFMGPTSYGNGIIDYNLYPRGWFVTDRRYELVLRGTF